LKRRCIRKNRPFGNPIDVIKGVLPGLLEKRFVFQFPTHLRMHVWFLHIGTVFNRVSKALIATQFAWFWTGTTFYFYGPILSPRTPQDSVPACNQDRYHG
jgi:hypothetical protein